MAATTSVDPREVAAGLRHLLDAIPASWERPGDRPTRYRLEGAYICAALLAGLDPLDAPTALAPDAVVDSDQKMI